MDLTTTIAPKSDQINADDLISGPVTVTIAEVVKGSPEQPVDIRLVEYPNRAYRPSKTMRRILVNAWGTDASTYTGRRITLCRNPDITFGREKVGGIEISHLSNIDTALTVALTSTRGKRKNYTVEPLPAERDWLTELAALNNDAEAIRGLGGQARAGNAPDAVIEAILRSYNEARQQEGANS